MSENRKRTLRFRVSEEEYSLLMERVGNVPYSEWIRAVILHDDPPPIEVVRTRMADPALLRELARIGNNLNQIARAVNAHKDKINLAWLSTEMISIEREIKDIKKVQNGGEIS